MKISKWVISLFAVLLVVVLLILLLPQPFPIQQLFFFQDPNFELDTSLPTRKWNHSIWHNNSDSYVNITNGIAYFKYNESTGSQWGASILYQGHFVHSSMPTYSQILGGKTEATAIPTDGVTFHKDYSIPANQYFLNVKIMLVDRKKIVNVPEDCPKGNIGIELMCSYTQKLPNGQVISPYYFNNDLSYRNNIRIAIVISSFKWNTTLNKFTDYEVAGYSGGSDWYWDNSSYDNDYHLHLVRGVMNQTGVWKEFKIDLSEIISTTFSVLNSPTPIAALTSVPAYIETITIRGVQVYVEGIGVSVEARMDYVHPAIITP